MAEAGGEPRIGVDIGGTFTDVVVASAGAMAGYKILTTPANPAQGVLEGVRPGLGGRGWVGWFVHGTTIGLNAILERRGARTAVVTTEGFRDVLAIGRGNRPAMYDLRYRKPKPLVTREDIFEVRERLAADGSVVLPLDPGSLARV